MSNSAPLFLDADAVRRFASMPALIEAMCEAMVAVSAQTVVMPQRQMAPIADDVVLAVMPGAASAIDMFGVKVISVHQGNAGTAVPVIQGCMLLFEERYGRLVAIIDAAQLTARRTAAVSALATRLLARPDARSHGILGTGVQALSHAEAVAASMPDVEQILIWGRSQERAKQLAKTIEQDLGRRALACVDAADAAACDIVSCVTSATAPVLRGKQLRPGSHVNLVGAHSATSREAYADVMRRARVYIDQRAAAAVEAGDILMWMEEDRADWGDIVGEIGHVAAGKMTARTNPDQITVFKSVGLSVQDIFAGRVVYRAAIEAA